MEAEFDLLAPLPTHGINDWKLGTDSETFHAPIITGIEVEDFECFKRYKKKLEVSEKKKDRVDIYLENYKNAAYPSLLWFLAVKK